MNVRPGVAVRLMGAIAVAASCLGGSVASPQQLWYAVYEQGLKAIEQQDWAAAERLLAAALKAHPQQSRTELFYGTRREVYIPEYHLARVYTAQGRDEEALAHLERVVRQKLVSNQDREWAELQRLRGVSQARLDQRRRDDETAQQRRRAELLDRGRNAVAQGRLPEARTAATGARAAGADERAVNELEGAIARAAEIADIGNRGQRAALERDPSELRRQRDALSRLDPSHPLLAEWEVTIATLAAATAPPTVNRDGGGPEPPAVSSPSATAAGAAAAVLRRGLRAFFAGNYRQAIGLLDGNSSPRSQVYLAFSHAGVGLLEGGTGERLSRARQLYARARAEFTLPVAERRYISPKILQAVEGTR